MEGSRSTDAHGPLRRFYARQAPWCSMLCACQSMRTEGRGARLRLQHDAGVLRVAHAALAGQAPVQRVAGVQAQPRRGGQHLQRAPARRRPQPRRALRPAAQGFDLGSVGFQAQPRLSDQHLQRVPARRQSQPRRALRPVTQGFLGSVGIQAQPRRGGQHLQRAPARRRPQPRRALRPAAQGVELGLVEFQA